MISSGNDERQDGGLEAVLGALQTESFPMDKEALYYAIGDLEIRDPSGMSFAARVLLDRIRQSRFHSVEEVARLLRRAAEAEVARTRPDADEG